MKANQILKMREEEFDQDFVEPKVHGIMTKLAFEEAQEEREGSQRLMHRQHRRQVHRNNHPNR